MRRLGVLCLAVLLLGACASGGDKQESVTTQRSVTTDVTQPIEQMQMKASQVTDLLIARKWAQVVATFNGSLKASYTVDSLKLAWGQVETEFGAYVSRGTTTRVRPSSTDVVFDTALTFKNKPGKSRIAFDTDGNISGFNILGADVP